MYPRRGFQLPPGIAHVHQIRVYKKSFSGKGNILMLQRSPHITVEDLWLSKKLGVLVTVDEDYCDGTYGCTTVLYGGKWVLSRFDLHHPTQKLLIHGGRSSYNHPLVAAKFYKYHIRFIKSDKESWSIYHQMTYPTSRRTLCGLKWKYETEIFYQPSRDFLLSRKCVVCNAVWKKRNT